VIIGKIAFQDPSEMAFSQHDHKFQTVASDLRG